MKKNFLYVLCVFIAFFITSCKKKDNTTGGASPITGPSTGDPTGTYNGFLVTLYLPTSTYTISTAVANFFTSSQNISVNTQNQGNTTVNSVFMNGVKFQLDPTGPTYGDTTNTLVFPNATWYINGSGTIPSFTYTNSDPLPVYSGSGISSLVDRSQNLTVPITGASGYDQILISIEDGGLGSRISTSSSAASVTFVKDSLAKLSACAGTAQIFVALIKYNAHSASGKNFLFGTVYYYTKQGVTIQ